MRARPQSSRTASAAFTLVELLLVMGVVGVLLGTGLGLLAGLNPGERAAVGLVRSTLRAANNSAVARTTPALVWLDREAQALVATSQRVVGTWRFEDGTLSGAFGLDGLVRGVDDAPLTERGYQGRGLDLARLPRGARVEFPVQEDPAFDPSDGFSIEAAVNLSGLAATTLLDLGDSLRVEVGPQAQLGATLVAEATSELGEPMRGARVTLRTGPGALRLGRWSRLRVTYDRRFLTLAVNGVELARRPEDARLWFPPGPLRLGGGPAPFPGVLDDLVISVVGERQVFVLPGGVEFGADAPDEVRFAPGGGLDPTAHEGPLVLPLEFVDGTKAQVRVGTYGTVE